MSHAQNGHDPAKQIQQQAEEHRHNTNLQAGAQQQQQIWGSEGNLRAEYIRELTDTSLEDPTVVLLGNMLSQDFVLGNLRAAELHEIQFLLRELELEVVRAHPPEESDITGEYRAYLFDDDHEALQPLSTKQRIEIQQLIMGVFMRATRSLDGWQQEEWSKVYNVSEVKNGESEKDKLTERIFS
jgi:hypothetical protein